ncbi:MAG: UPF0149 family protein, partial [Vibrio metschnikovii]
MTLNDILSAADLEDKLLNEAKTQGFITAMALAPNVLPPSEWLPFLWGDDDTAPFSDAKQMESYFGLIIRLWNEYRPALLDGSWSWPEGCELDEEDIVTQNT